MPAILQNGLPAAGIVAGPLAVIGSMEANYALVPWACGSGVPVLSAVTAFAVAVAIAGGALSWRSLATEPEPRPFGGRPRRFLAHLGLITAGLGVAVVLLQGLAPLLVGPCLR